MSKEDKIRTLAYEKWEKAGCPVGDGSNFWCEAEAEITTEEECAVKTRKAAKVSSTPKKK